MDIVVATAANFVKLVTFVVVVKQVLPVIPKAINYAVDKNDLEHIKNQVRNVSHQIIVKVCGEPPRELRTVRSEDSTGPPDLEAGSSIVSQATEAGEVTSLGEPQWVGIFEELDKLLSEIAPAHNMEVQGHSGSWIIIGYVRGDDGAPSKIPPSKEAIETFVIDLLEQGIRRGYITNEDPHAIIETNISLVGTPEFNDILEKLQAQPETPFDKVFNLEDEISFRQLTAATAFELNALVAGVKIKVQRPADLVEKKSGRFITAWDINIQNHTNFTLAILSLPDGSEEKQYSVIQPKETITTSGGLMTFLENNSRLLRIMDNEGFYFYIQVSLNYDFAVTYEMVKKHLIACMGGSILAFKNRSEIEEFFDNVKGAQKKDSYQTGVIYYRH